MKGLSSIFLVGLIFNCSCSDYTPKPSGYFRIELDDPEYNIFSDSSGAFSFNVQKTAMIEVIPGTTGGECFNIVYPPLNAVVYCTFSPLLSPDDLSSKSEESRKFAYVHILKAEGISEKTYSDPDHRVYALLYEIQGNTVSPLQFVITDSIRYFFRGALYFDSTPNRDSIAPVKTYIGNDVREIIESFRYNEKVKKKNKE